MNGNSVKDKMARINLKAVLSGFPYFFLFFPFFLPKEWAQFFATVRTEAAAQV